MSTITSSEFIHILDKYLKKNFYVNLEYESGTTLVYYNTITYDIFSIISHDFKESLAEIEEFSDYISLVSSSTAKIDYSDPTIGLIYVDRKAQSENESIIISRLPSLREISKIHRKDFVLKYTKMGFFRPFWEYYNSEQSDKPDKFDNTVVDEEKIANGKKMIDKAIDTYCQNNTVPRENIQSLASFMDHLLPDIFKYKISVAQEQQIHTEIKNIDTMYPEVFLQSLHVMGYL